MFKLQNHTSRSRLVSPTQIKSHIALRSFIFLSKGYLPINMVVEAIIAAVASQAGPLLLLLATRATSLMSGKTSLSRRNEQLSVLGRNNLFKHIKDARRTRCDARDLLNNITVRIRWLHYYCMCK